MSELELQLRTIGVELDWPQEPELAARVRRRIEGEAPRGRLLARPRLVVAFALLVAVVAGALAVPPARTAILELLGIRGVEVVRVSELPELSPTDDSGLYVGRPVSLDGARRLSRHDVLLPELEGGGRPDGVFVEPGFLGKPVSLVWGSARKPRLLIVQFAASPLIEKVATFETSVERVQVDGGRGLWFAGAEHEIFYRDAQDRPIRDTQRLAGNTLVWERGPLTLRLEGDLSKDEALRIARSMR